jgi:hypothetical protein
MDFFRAFYPPPSSAPGFYPPPASIGVFTPSIEDAEAAGNKILQLLRYDIKVVQIAYEELPDTCRYITDKRRLHGLKFAMRICRDAIRMYAETATIRQPPSVDYVDCGDTSASFDKRLSKILAKMYIKRDDDARSFHKRLCDAFHELCDFYHDTANGVPLAST